MYNKTFLRQIKNQKKHWWFQARKKIIEELIISINFKKEINILDFGAGSGVNTDMLFKYGIVDVHEKNKIARSYLKKNTKIKRIYSNLKLKKNFYDLILLADVVEHIKYPQNILKILKKSLKKNGYILLTVPSYQFLFSSKDLALGHYRRYNKKNIQKIINKFKVLKISYFNTILFLPIAFTIMLYKIFQINYNDEAETTPPYIINKILYFLFLIEKYFIKKIDFSFGLSIYALIKK